MPLAVAVVLACPPPTVTRLLLRVVLAPLAGAVKTTWPPSTGSAPAPLTLTVRGAGNGALGGVLWLSPHVLVSVNPWLSKAPMSTAPPTERGRPRWSAAPAFAEVAASIAGLFGRSAWVWVGPPYEPSAASSGAATPT